MNVFLKRWRIAGATLLVYLLYALPAFAARDPTPPTIPMVIDDGVSTASATQLHASWSSSDPESRIAKYRYSLRQDSTSGTVIVRWTSTKSTSVTRTGLSLLQGNTYYFAVKARNKVGLWSAIGYSDGIKVDTTPPTGTISINNGAAYTLTTAVTLSLSATDNSGVVSQMQFSNDHVTYATPEPYATTTTWMLTSGDGTKTVYVKFKDAAGNWSNSIHAQITLDTTSPSAPGIDPVTSPTNQTSQTLTGTKEADTGIWLGEREVVAFNSATTWSYPAALSEGTNAFTFTAKDQAGNASSGRSVTIVRDTTGPSLSAVTATDIAVSSATITWTTDEAASSQVEYGPTTSYGQRTVLDSTLLTTHRVALSGLTAGTLYHARVRSTDTAGNEALSADFTFTTPPADTTPPTGSVSINGDTAYTTTTAVTLTLSATDDSGTVSQMQCSNDGTTYSNDEPYATTKVWTLPSGDGSKTVYVKFADAAGNRSAPVSDTIGLDTSPPPAPVLSDDGVYTTSISQLHATWTASSDPESGTVDYQYQIRQDSTSGLILVDWTSVGLATEVTHTALSLIDGKQYFVGVRATNGAGLVSAGGYSDGILVQADTISPSGTISINNGALYTMTPTVTLTLSATDNSGVVSQMQFSDDHVTYTPAEPYATTKPWSLPSGDGPKTVYVKFADAASPPNWSSPASDSITVDTVPPSGTITSLPDGAVLGAQ